MNVISGTWASGNLNRLLSGLIVLSFIFGAVHTVYSAPVGDNLDTVIATKTLTREDPVVCLGSQFPAYVSAQRDVDNMFIWAWREGGWKQVVFQIDEANGTFVRRDTGGALGIHKNFYMADNGYIDNDDEICFMANETGDRVNIPMWAPGANTSVQRYEITVTDPLDTTKKGWAYMFYHDTPPTWTTVDYVSWTEATNYVDAYGYSINYFDDVAKRISFNDMRVKSSLGGTNTDFVDRDKKVVNVAVTIDPVRSEYGSSTRGIETYYPGQTSSTWDWQYYDDYGIRDGPVRVVRHIRWGFGSANAFNMSDKMGFRAHMEYKYYSNMYVEDEYILVQTTGAKSNYYYRSVDHAAAACPMAYYNSESGTGTINGNTGDDSVPTTLMLWDQVSSPHGSYFTRYKPCTFSGEGTYPITKTTRWIDNSAATDTDGTRTGAEAGRYGEHGLYMENPNSINYWGTGRSNYYVYFLPANSPNVGAAYYTNNINPLVTNLPSPAAQTWVADHYPPSTNASTVLVGGLTSMTVPVSTAGNVVLTATIDDSTQGNSNVASAVWTDGFTNFPGTAMTATDGSFNSPNEAVRATINLATFGVGVHDLHVYGTDQDQNKNETSTEYARVTIVDDRAPATNTGTVLVDGAATHTVLFSETAPVHLTATVDDSNRGFSDIVSAVWTPQFAAFPGTSMTAVDGVFDTHFEPVEATLDLPAWDAGVYNVHVYGTDATPLQNTTSTQHATITIIDDVAPAVNSVLLNGQAVLSMTISDYPIINLTATVDDAGKGGTVIAGANYTIGQYQWPGSAMNPVDALDTATESFLNQIDTTGWTPGAYLFYMYGQDSAGNNNITSGQYALLKIENDWAPEMRNVLVNEMQTISVPFSSRGTVTLNATVDDTGHGNNIIAGANYTVGIANWPSVKPMTPVNALDSMVEDFTATVDISAWARGTYDLYAYGWDECNDFNATSELFARVIIYDDVAPTIDTVRINGLAIYETANSGAGTVTVTAWVDDSLTGESIIGGANYTVGPQNWASVSPMSPVNALDSAREQFSASLDLSTWSAGVYYLYAYGWDSIPNRNLTSGAYAILIIHDVLAPTVNNVRINGTSIFSVDYANATSVELTALLDDTGRGDSEIGGANYTLGFRDWSSAVPMATYNDEAIGEVSVIGIESSDDYTAPNNYQNTMQLPDDNRYEHIQEEVGIETPAVQGFQASGSATTSTNLVLTAPAGIQVGELLLLIVENDYNAAGPEFNAVTGWTKINEAGSATPDAFIGAYWRIADGTEGASVTVTSAHARSWLGWYIRISGADTANPINVQNFATSTGTGTNPQVIPQVTTTADNCLAIYGLSFDGGDGLPMSVDAAWTERAELAYGTTTAGVSGSWGTKVQAAAGGTGTASVTTSGTDGASYFQLAIRPLVANRIDHRWQFDMGSNSVFYVEASNPAGSDSTFKFQWSSNGGGTWNDFTTNIQFAAGETNVLKSSAIALAAYCDNFLVRAVTINPGANADTLSIDRMWATGQFNNNPEAVYKVIDISSWQPGEYQLYVYGWDKTPQYNVTSRAYATLIITDNLPPEIYDFLVGGAKHVTLNLSESVINLTGRVDDSNTGNADIAWGAYAHENENYSIGEYMTNDTALDSPAETFTQIVDVSGWHAENNSIFMFGGDAVGMNNETSDENVTVNIIDDVAPDTADWSIKLNGASECWVDPFSVSIVSLTATVTDVLHGYSNITSANWTNGPANWTDNWMLPNGGVWDNYTKSVSGTINITSWIPGTYYIYVYGTDSWGNGRISISTYAILYLDNKGPEIEGPWAGPTVNTATQNPYVWVTATSFVLKAFGDDRARGHSDVVAAEYFTDTIGANGTGVSMANTGFRFDSPYEGAKATITCSGWAPGEYHVYWIHFLDAMGEWGDWGSVLVMRQGPSFNINITAGWNLISLPLITPSSDLATILAGISWDHAFIYDPLNPNPWLSHWNGGPEELNDFTNVDRAMGIWVHALAAGTLTISGGVPSSTAITLHAGWNLVGYPTLTEGMSALDALAGTGADMIAVSTAASPFIMDIVDLSTVTMTPGSGYWVHVTSDTVWTVNW